MLWRHRCLPSNPCALLYACYKVNLLIEQDRPHTIRISITLQQLITQGPKLAGKDDSLQHFHSSQQILLQFPDPLSSDFKFLYSSNDFLDKHRLSAPTISWGTEYQSLAMLLKKSYFLLFWTCHLRISSNNPLFLHKKRWGGGRIIIPSPCATSDLDFCSIWSELPFPGWIQFC